MPWRRDAVAVRWPAEADGASDKGGRKTMSGEMIINANDVPTPTVAGGAVVGIPLTYYSPASYAPPNGWIGNFGGFSFIFSATQQILTDSLGTPIGFTVHF